ncbi:hypothetical protein ICE98_02130 [Lactococcus lactis]|nr:hypothetical protein [Lactococcus lactis]
MLKENKCSEKIYRKLVFLKPHSEEVAKELYFSRQAISRWESNKTEPNFETLIALAELYESDLSAFAQGIEPQKRKKHINLFAGFCFAIFQLCPWGLVDYCYCSILLALYAIILALFLAPFIMIFAVATHNPHITLESKQGQQVLNCLTG